MKKVSSVEEKAIKLINVISVGDVHGKFGELGYKIKNKYQLSDSVICLCGDIGMGFHKPGYYTKEWEDLNKIAAKGNNIIIAVRGNHDDPEYFKGHFQFENIKLVADYTVIETKENRILFIGGATSVDRKHRDLDISYWSGEIPVYDEDKLKAAKKPDIIITHTAPSFAYPTTKVGLMEWAAHDYSIVEDCAYERNVFDKIYEYLKKRKYTPHTWAYGHFHMSNKDVFENTLFKVNQELEFFNIPLKK
jgi:predicted phosphodiesterase